MLLIFNSIKYRQQLSIINWVWMDFFKIFLFLLKGDMLHYHNDMMFSTRDQDNDISMRANECVRTYTMAPGGIMTAIIPTQTGSTLDQIKAMPHRWIGIGRMSMNRCKQHGWWFVLNLPNLKFYIHQIYWLHD